MLEVNNVLNKLGLVKNETQSEIQPNFGLRNAGKNLAPLKKDAVSFSGSIKFVDFSDMTKALIKKLGIEPKYCRTKRGFDATINKAFKEEVVEKNFFGSHQQTNILRDDLLQDWRKHLVDDKAYDPATSLMIFRAVTKNLKQNDYNLPLKFDEKVLSEVVSDFQKTVLMTKKGADVKFDFAKIYEQKYYDNKWSGEKLKINSDPLKKPKGELSNVYEIPILSNKKGKAIVSAQIKNGKIVKLEYPKSYVSDVKAYIKMHDLRKSLSAPVMEKLDLDQILSTKLAVFKKESADLYAKKDYKAIMGHFGIDLDDKWVRSKLRDEKPFFDYDFLYSLEDLGVSQKQLVKYLNKYDYNKLRDAGFSRADSIDYMRYRPEDEVKIFVIDE